MSEIVQHGGLHFRLRRQFGINASDALFKELSGSKFLSFGLFSRGRVEDAGKKLGFSLCRKLLLFSGDTSPICPPGQYSHAHRESNQCEKGNGGSGNRDLVTEHELTATITPGVRSGLDRVPVEQRLHIARQCSR